MSNAAIYGPDDEKPATASHVYGAGDNAQIILNIGGFPGIGAKPVAVRAREPDFMRDVDGAVYEVTSWTKDQLKAMPEHRHQAETTVPEEVIYDHPRYR